ncbi:MAG: PQQ-binding-like beta-propeller repeat protein [Candidatus Polarisedimenticolia bacterium]
MTPCTWLIALALAAAPPPPADPNGSAVPSPSQDAALKVAWEAPLPGTPLPWVTGAASRVVVSSREGRMAAWDPQGSPLWTATLDSSITSAPVRLPDRIGVMGGDGFARLLDDATGNEVARAGPFSPVSHLADVGRGLAVADPAGLVTVIDPNSGARLWEARTQESPSVAVSQCGGIVLAGTSQGSLLGFDAETGELLWRRELGAAVTTPPGCWRRYAYLGSADNRLHAFKLSRKRANPMWSYMTGGDIVGRPFTFAGKVLFFSYDTYLYSLKTDNGHLAWKARLGRRPREESILMGRLLVVAPLNTERLETFELPEGTQGASLSLPTGQGRFVSSPAVAGNRIIIATAAYGDEGSRVLGLDLP